MRGAGWLDVWDSVLAALAVEPTWFQIAVALGAAFAVAMCLEGIRASFFPRRYAETLARKYAPQPVTPRDAESSVDGSVQPGRAKSGALPRRVARNRKLASPSLNPHAAPRPRIQRVAMVKVPPDTASAVMESTRGPAV
jgi:hypothetical protein